MPSCLVVQHLEPEGPYAIAVALEVAGLEVDVCRVHRGDAIPVSAGAYAAIVVMGGPMAAHDDAGFPTRRAEIALLGDALEHEVPVLGVCLGAQLLAAAAGARSFPGPFGPEIGWGPVELTGEAALDTLFTGLPQRLDVLHWHGDTFELPAGATLLAGSDSYAHQAFRSGEFAWGLQFHIEVDARAVTAFVEHLGGDARAAGVNPVSIESATPAALARLTPARDQILVRFAELARSRVRIGSEAL